MPTRAAKASTRVLFVSYISAVSVMVVLILSAQGLIQYTLHQEVSSRNLAGAINLEELRTQFILREAILLLTPQAPAERASTISQLTSTDAKWYQTGEGIYNGSDTLALHPADFPVAGLVALRKEQPDFEAMQQATVHLLTLVAAAQPEERLVAREVGTIFFRESAYLPALYSLFNLMTAEADAYVTEVQVIELVLCGLSLLTLVAEVLFVVRPTNRQMQRQIDQLAEKLALAHQP